MPAWISPIVTAERTSAERAAHTLKGLGAQVGGRRFSACAAALDQRLKAGDTDLEADVNALRVECGALCEALQQWQQTEG